MQPGLGRQAFDHRLRLPCRQCSRVECELALTVVWRRGRNIREHAEQARILQRKATPVKTTSVTKDDRALAPARSYPILR